MIRSQQYVATRAICCGETSTSFILPPHPPEPHGTVASNSFHGPLILPLVELLAVSKLGVGDTLLITVGGIGAKVAHSWKKAGS